MTKPYQEFAHYSFSQQLGELRVRVFVGPDCLDQLEQWLLSNPRWPLPERIVCIPGAQRRLPAGISEAVVMIGQTQSDMARTALAQLDRVYANRDASYWRERLNQKPFRIMAFTSRFTVVLQHTLRALLAAYGEMDQCFSMLLMADTREMAIG